jgi:hypothetical protein
MLRERAHERLDLCATVYDGSRSAAAKVRAQAECRTFSFRRCFDKKSRETNNKRVGYVILLIRACRLGGADENLRQRQRALILCLYIFVRTHKMREHYRLI